MGETFWVLLLMIVSFGNFSHGEVVTGDEKVPGGQFRYFYDAVRGPAACSNVVLIGVGTGMSIKDYNLISNEIVVGRDIVAIITDHAPGYTFKNSEEQYIRVIDAIVANLTSKISICNANVTTTSTDTSIDASTDATIKTRINRKIIIGGHSASGGTAWRCLSKLTFRPDGYLGLDPYRLDPKGPKQNEIPTLSFGFTEDTCAVKIDWAAKATYITSGVDHRVLYLIDNQKKREGNITKVMHCSFTDRGCFGPICSGGGIGDEWVRASVGLSVGAFVESLVTGLYSRQEYNVPTTGMYPTYALFVNTEEVVPRTVLPNGAASVPLLNVAFA